MFTLKKMLFWVPCTIALLLTIPASANDNSMQTARAPVSDKSGDDSSSTISTWHDRRWQRTIPQTLETSCSAGAIATLLSFHFNDPTSEKAVLRWIWEHRQSHFPGGDTRRGVSMAEMRVFLESRGYAATNFAVMEPEAKVRSLPKIPAPVILHLEPWGQGHFVVLESVQEGWARIADPAQGNRRVLVAELSDQWSGKLLVVERPIR